MNADEKIAIDQMTKRLKRALYDTTPSKQRKRRHKEWLTERRQRRRAIIRQYIDAQPKPTQLTEAQMRELAGFVGCTTARLRQDLKYVLLHT